MTIYVDYSHRDFKSQARTLNPSYVGFNSNSEWTIDGVIREDYYSWVNEFEAIHPVYGFVKGDFEGEVSASSQEALDHFLKFHEPDEWDYYDI